MSLFRRNKNNNKPVIRQIIDLIPRHLLNKSVLKYQSDKYCHKYKTYDQLIALLFGQLCKCSTLEDISVGIGVSETFIKDLGLQWWLAYSSVLVLLHHFALFYLEAFRFSEFFNTLSRVLLSSVATLLLILITQLLFGSKFSDVATILPLTFLGSALFGLGQALTIPLFVARDTVTPNLGRVIALGTYVLLIIFYPPADPLTAIKHYAILFASTQIIYPAILGVKLFLLVKKT